MDAGDLTKRATFQRPEMGRDGDGNQILAYVDDHAGWVHLRPLRGGESVMAARLASKAPAIVTLRASANARRVTSEWRVLIEGRTYEAKEDPRETQDRAYLELLAEG
ncbi:phage head closure protein [Paracoccus sp. (in: a-proteobacteria)]|uniref:phage head closure protein n=1 Tax=Paracoccus sp. TaxID=267 RepID=UPI0032201786